MMRKVRPSRRKADNPAGSKKPCYAIGSPCPNLIMAWRRHAVPHAGRRYDCWRDLLSLVDRATEPAGTTPPSDRRHNFPLDGGRPDTGLNVGFGRRDSRGRVLKEGRHEAFVDSSNEREKCKGILVAGGHTEQDIQALKQEKHDAESGPQCDANHAVEDQ